MAEPVPAPRVLYTPRLALPYPVGVDPADVPADILALATRLDTTVCVTGQGSRAQEPSGYTRGLIWWSTETRQAYYDTGTEWVPIGPYSVQGLAADRPATSHQGAQYVSLDTGHVDYYTGQVWVTVGGRRHWRALGSGSGDGASGVPDSWTMAASPLIPLPVEGQWYRVRAQFTLMQARLSDTGVAWVQTGLSWYFSPGTPLPGTFRTLWLNHQWSVAITLEAEVQGMAGAQSIGITYCPGMDQMICYLLNQANVIPMLTVEEIDAPSAAIASEGAGTLPPTPADYDIPAWEPPVMPRYPDRNGATDE
jgi:hypothetical protein